MLRAIKTNAAVRKAIVFFTVFAFAGLIFHPQMGNYADGAYVQNEVKRLTHLQTAPDSQAVDVYKMSPLVNDINDINDMVYDLDVKHTQESNFESAVPYLDSEAVEFVYLEELPISKSLQEYTYALCKENNLDYALVLAVMWKESRFDIAAVNVNTNGTQDSGLMQINDINKEWLKENGIHDLMDPEQNIEAGIMILSKYRKKYDMNKAMMAYQLGETGMLEKIDSGISSTQYTQSLYEKREHYKVLLEAA